MYSFVKLLLFFIYFIVKCESALNLKMEVPSHVENGSNVTLRCFNNFEGEFSLFSIKWYKDSQEFLSYTRYENSTEFKISQSNLTIQYDVREKGAIVHLKEVTQEAEGRYMCKMTTGVAPLFYTDYQEENLTIYEISSPGPLLIGHLKNEFKNGNPLRYTCSFRKSKPKPILSWFVDKQEVVGQFKFRYTINVSSAIDTCCESKVKWWSIQSSLILWPSAAQVEKGISVVSCRIIVLNETIYQQIATITITSPTFSQIPINHIHNIISMLGIGYPKRIETSYAVLLLYVFIFIIVTVIYYSNYIF